MRWELLLIGYLWTAGGMILFAAFTRDKPQHKHWWNALMFTAVWPVLVAAAVVYEIATGIAGALKGQ